MLLVLTSHFQQALRHFLFWVRYILRLTEPLNKQTNKQDNRPLNREYIEVTRNLKTEAVR